MRVNPANLSSLNDPLGQTMVRLLITKSLPRTETPMTSLTPSPSFSLTVRLEIPNRAGQLATILQAIGEVGGNLGPINLVDQTRHMAVREITIEATSPEHEERIIQTLKGLPQVRVLSVDDRTFKLHQGGKIHLQSKIPLKNRADLAMAYTPGVGSRSTLAGFTAISFNAQNTSLVGSPGR